MLGHITEWFYKDLAGIGCDPAGPGFKKILIKPTPAGDLEWVKASYNSPHGRIVSQWAQQEGTLTLKVRIPANTAATVHVPAPGVDSAAVVGDGEGVKFLRREDGRALFAVGSGEYEFTSKY
jgi:alpha-L-rhamnosidase